MKNPISQWMQQLKNKGTISSFTINGIQHHRLAHPCEFKFSDDKIALLKENYDAGKEKGGLFLFSIHQQKEAAVLQLEEIVFVKNISSIPSEEYEADDQELRLAVLSAIERELIPCMFHSHPTKERNVVMEMMEYNFQMNTSDADKVASAFEYYPNGSKLRLPEFLVVGNGSMKSGIFIGVYGGLIAPLCFSERKHEMIEKFIDNALEKASTFFNTPQRKLAGVVGAALLIYLGSKYQQGALNLFVTAAGVMPSIIYSTHSRNAHFVMTYGMAVCVEVPGYAACRVIADEKKISMLRKKIRSSHEKTII